MGKSSGRAERHDEFNGRLKALHPAGGLAARARGVRRSGPAEPESRPSRQLRVLHVAESIKGGVGTYLAELVPLQIATLGQAQIRVVIPEEHKEQVARLPNACIATFSRPDRNTKSILSLMYVLQREVRNFKPDIIHAHSSFAGFAARLLFGWRRGRMKIIYTPHGWSFARGLPGDLPELYRAVEASLVGLCDRIVAVSEHEAQLAREIGVGSGKLSIVFNGIAQSAPQTIDYVWDDPRLKVLYIGRLDYAKGYDILRTALDEVGDKVSFRTAGESVVNDDLSGLSVAREEFLGWLSPPELAGVLRASDVVVIPSRSEAFGLVAIEAMRAGKMVVATRVGGLPEVVEDGVTGVLVPLEDPAAFRDILLRLTPQEAAVMGQRGRERFLANFSIENTDSMMRRIYDDLVAARRQAGIRPGPSGLQPVTGNKLRLP